jgi:chemotaxis protein MotA
MAREMMLEGVVSILEGLNPRMVEIKLRSFLAAASQQSSHKEEVKRS